MRRRLRSVARVLFRTLAVAVLLSDELLAQNAKASNVGTSTSKRAPELHATESVGPRDARAMIWVQDASGRLVEYDAVEFRTWRSLKLPSECADNRAILTFHRNGMFLCMHPTETSARQTIEIGGPLTTLRALTARSDDRRQADSGGFLQTTISPDVVFDADTKRLYWFENRLIELQRGETVTRQPSRFSVWTSDSRGGDRQRVLSLSLSLCACPTESCEESCPELKAWVPDEGVSDFFFLTKWTPGQTESDFLETRLYQRRSGRWSGHLLPHVIETLLDAKQHGKVFVWAINDAGCCGWDNVSNDRTFVTIDDKEMAIFDERARFGNLNYDVSFFTPAAKLSPSAARVAYTVGATVKPGDEIRLADQGKENPAELARIKKAIAELPRVEVQKVGSPNKVVARAPGSWSVGWTSRVCWSCTTEM